MRLYSGFFGRFSAAVVFTAVAISFAYPAGSATADKQLSHVKGQVGYKASENETPKNIFASQIVADNAFAVTGPKSMGELRMPDSSIIEIGADTIVRVGAFHTIAPGQTNQDANVITVNNGIVHFVIKHPEGTQANYKFQTPTSQIAVRGTEGSILVSTSSTGVTTTTVTIASGSVVVTTGTTQAVVNAGQAVSAAAPAGTSASTSATMSNTVTAAPGAGTSAAAASASTTATTAATTAAAAGAATAATAAVASNSSSATATPEPTPTPTPAPTPTPQPGQTSTPTPAPSPGAIIVTDPTGSSQNQAVSSDFFATLPSTKTVTIAQANCITALTVTASPVGSTTFNPASLPCTNGNIAGSVAVTTVTYASSTYTVIGSGQTLTHVENAFGPPVLTESGQSNPATIAVNGPGSIPMTVTQAGPNPTLTVALDCSATTAPNYHSTDPAVAGIGLGTLGNYNLSDAAVAAFSLVVKSGPIINGASTNQPNPCNIVVNGSANVSVTISVSITTTNIGITGVTRTLQTGPRKPK